MPVGRQIVKLIGWAFVIAGFLMRITGTTFSGTYLDRKGWQSSIMDGKALIFFGLVFLVYHYIILPKKNNA